MEKGNNKCPEVRFRFFGVKDKEKAVQKAKVRGLTLSAYIRTLVYKDLNDS